MLKRFGIKRDRGWKVPINGYEIEKRLTDKEERDFNKKLIITPILDWDKQLNKGAASFDVRLGSWFMTPARSRLSELDPLSEAYTSETLKIVNEAYINIGEYFVLHPHQFALGITLEWLHLPYDLSAYVLGRSSWGREGLIIATATGVQPGFSGVLILELSNIGEIPIKLYPGVTIAQLFFHRVSTEYGTDRDESLFFGQTKPNRAGPISKLDIRIIDSLKRENPRFEPLR
jgi:dCTP deaminase